MHQYASLVSRQITSVYLRNVTKSKSSFISCWCSSPAEFLFITATPKLMFWAYHWYRCHRSHNVLLSGTRPIDRPSTWPGSFTVSQLHYIPVNFSDHFSSHPNYSFISPLPQIEPEAERCPVSYSDWINWCESHSFFSIIFPFQWSTRESYTVSTSLHDFEAHHFRNYEIASSSSRVPGHPHGIRIGVVFFAGAVAFKHENPESSLIYQSFIQHLQRNPLQILSSCLFNSI